MRKTIILPMLLTVSAAFPAAHAGDLPASAVPAPVREAFAAAFPQATSLEWDWDEDDRAYEVDARDGRREIEAAYTEAGRLIRSKSTSTRRRFPRKSRRVRSSAIRARRFSAPTRRRPIAASSGTWVCASRVGTATWTSRNKDRPR